MGMAVILFDGAEPFQQIVYLLLTEGPMWNLMKTVQAFSEKTLKDFRILYMYIAKGQGQITPKSYIVKMGALVAILDCRPSWS